MRPALTSTPIDKPARVVGESPLSTPQRPLDLFRPAALPFRQMAGATRTTNRHPHHPTHHTVSRVPKHHNGGSGAPRELPLLDVLHVAATLGVGRASLPTPTTRYLVVTRSNKICGDRRVDIVAMHEVDGHTSRRL